MEWFQSGNTIGISIKLGTWFKFYPHLYGGRMGRCKSVPSSFSVSEGSGYDIACASADSPIIYQLLEDQVHYNEFDLNINFSKICFLFI